MSGHEWPKQMAHEIPVKGSNAALSAVYCLHVSLHVSLYVRLHVRMPVRLHIQSAWQFACLHACRELYALRSRCPLQPTCIPPAAHAQCPPLLQVHRSRDQCFFFITQESRSHWMAGSCHDLGSVAAGGVHQEARHVMILAALLLTAFFKRLGLTLVEADAWSLIMQRSGSHRMAGSCHDFGGVAADGAHQEARADHGGGATYPCL